jgi:predicted nucleic acid-binding protein
VLPSSLLTYGELLFGAEKSANRAQALQLLEEMVLVVRLLEQSLDTGRQAAAFD